MKKAPFQQICSIFIIGPSVYETDRPASGGKFDKDTSSDTCLRNKKKICTYFIYVVGHGSLLYATMHHLSEALSFLNWIISRQGPL